MMDEHLTEEAQEIVPALREQHKIERRSPVLNAAMITSIFIIIVTLVWIIASYTSADSTLRQQGQIHDNEISDLQEQMKGVCRKVTNLNQLTPQEKEGCYRAENSIPPPSPNVITEQPQITVQGLNEIQVQQMINAAIASLPKPVTLDQVVAAATAVFQANKPHELTQQDIVKAVGMYCGENVCKGDKGESAPPVTAQSIDQAVRNYCNPPNGVSPCAVPGPVGPAGEKGDKGDRGDPGVSVVDISNPQGDLSHCYIRFTFDRPNLNGETFKDVTVPVTFCVP